MTKFVDVIYLVDIWLKPLSVSNQIYEKTDKPYKFGFFDHDNYVGE